MTIPGATAFAAPPQPLAPARGWQPATGQFVPTAIAPPFATASTGCWPLGAFPDLDPVGDLFVELFEEAF